MLHLRWALLATLTALGQTYLLPSFLRTTTDLVLISGVVWTLLAADQRGAMVVFYGGIVLDLLAFTTLGTHVIGGLITVAITISIAERLPTDNWLLVLLLVGTGTLINQLAIIVLTGGTSNWVGWGSIILAPAAIVNLISALPIFLLLYWWYERRPELE